MEKEIRFTEIDINEKILKNNELKLETNDLPIRIILEGRSNYVLKLTKNDCLILNKKE